MKFKNGISFILAATMASSVLCTACMNDDSLNSEEMWEAESAVMDSISYEALNKQAASPQHEVLYQNEEKTVVYCVKYYADTTAEKAAAEFEKGKEDISKEKSTWEDNLRKYNDLIHESEGGIYRSLHINCCNWYIELWKYEENDEQKNTVTETLFFERGDGCYSVEMIYPTNDTVARNVLYRMITRQEFEVDEGRIERIKGSMEWDYDVNDESGLVITVTNNSDEIIGAISCSINAEVSQEKRISEGIEDFNDSRIHYNVKSEETIIFNLSVEEIKSLTKITDGQEELINDYNFEIAFDVMDCVRMVDEEGKLWYCIY